MTLKYFEEKKIPDIFIVVTFVYYDVSTGLTTNFDKCLVKDVFNQLIILKPSQILPKKSTYNICLSNVEIDK